jgi:hypothetical protein
MAETLLYGSTNDYSTRQVPGGQQLGVGGATKRTYDGWCVASSARWLHHVLQGKAPGQFDPVGDVVNKNATGSLMGMYNWGDRAADDQELLKTLDRLGIDGTLSGDMYLNGVLNRMATVNGMYMFADYGHVMAASTRVGSLYFYDIEEGLWHFDTIDEWKDRIRQGYGAGGGGGRQWLAILCTF